MVTEPNSNKLNKKGTFWLTKLGSPGVALASYSWIPKEGVFTSFLSFLLPVLPPSVDRAIFFCGKWTFFTKLERRPLPAGPYQCLYTTPEKVLTGPTWVLCPVHHWSLGPWDGPPQVPPLVSNDSTVASGGQSCPTAAEPRGVGGRGPQRRGC